MTALANWTRRRRVLTAVPGLVGCVLLGASLTHNGEVGVPAFILVVALTQVFYAVLFGLVPRGR